jgi:hypothetical protein
VTIAVAPHVPLPPPRTISELENDIDAGSGFLNQMQQASLPGLDLSVLIKNAMCPFNQLDEQDAPWEWDMVFTKVRNEMNPDRKVKA